MARELYKWNLMRENNLHGQVRIDAMLLVRSMLILLICFIGFSGHGQGINLDEIYKIRSMDSLALREYSLAKGFKLKSIVSSSDKLVHKYYFAEDSSVWFVRSFPKDTTRDKHVYFYYGVLKLNQQFQKEIRKHHFKLDSSEDSDYDGNIIRREIYLKDGMEIILGYESFAGRPRRYVLMYQKQFKMYKNQSPQQN